LQLFFEGLLFLLNFRTSAMVASTSEVCMTTCVVNYDRKLTNTMLELLLLTWWPY